MEFNILKDNKGKGFTLLELLIVIALIGILVSIGVVSYSQAQKKTRDSRREGDLKSLQAAYEQYNSDWGAYPFDNSTSSNCPASIESAGHSYLPAGYPVDPKNTGTYVYNYSCTTTSFCFCANLESGTGNAAAASSAPCSYGAGSYYCVGNLQ